jgi:hypothetical protein
MRHATLLLLAALAASLIAPVSAQAATATTTTLDVPSGTRYGSFTVSAHVTPAPQPTDGFIPAVMFIVDGGGGLPAPLDSNGDASTELSLSAGSHTVKASFGPFAAWDASESSTKSVQVGIPTQISLESNRNPALSTQSVTISATVSPSSVTGGTLTIVDAFDGSTIATGSVGPGDTTVAFTGLFDAGNHVLSATYTGHGDFGPSEDGLTQTIQPDSGVDATAGVQFATFYPFRDTYRDTNALRGTLREPASVVIRVYTPSNVLFRTFDLGHRVVGAYSHAWNGRNAAGAILRAGTYRIVQRITDDAGNVKTATFRVAISHKRLRWTTSSITLYGSQIRAAADPGNGYISPSRSAYYRGVRLNSGRAGVAVAYRFVAKSALRYGNTITFRVLGRSTNGTRVAEGLWNHSYCPPLGVDCYDQTLMGPSYRWWSMSASSELHLHGRTAWGLVSVQYAGTVRSFDVAKVRLTYRWAVLR